jgi:hypothetical protein
MIFFDWPTVFTESEALPHKLLDIITYITLKPIPKNHYDAHIKRLSVINWVGHSFLLNPRRVITARDVYPDEKLAEYVALASFRNYNQYKVTKQTTLSVYECPVSTESKTQNKLLTIQNDKIYFCWEEVLH